MPLPAIAIKLCLSGKINAVWVILATVLFPCAYITYMVQQGAGPVVSDLASTKLLLDPGPRHRCYQYHDLGLNISHVNQAPECQSLLGYGGCPMWRYSSFDAASLNHNDLLVGGNGSLIDVLLFNNARINGTKPIEVSFDYYCPGCSIQQLTNNMQYNLLEFDQWIFEYDVTIRSPNGISEWSSMENSISSLSNSEKRRRYLNTEFIYQYPDPICTSRNDDMNNKSAAANVRSGPSSTRFKRFVNSSLPTADCPPLQSTISITHFDSDLANTTSVQLASPVDSDVTGNLGLRAIRNNTVLSLLSPTVVAHDSKTHITLDFKSIFQKYIQTNQASNSTNSTHSTDQLPASLNAHMIRIVSGAQGLSSIVVVRNVSAVLVKGNRKTGNLTTEGYGVLNQQEAPNVRVTAADAGSKQLATNNTVRWTWAEKRTRKFHA